MKLVYSFLVLSILLPNPNLQSQNDTITLLFQNSFTAFELMRNDIGVYRDAKVLSGSDFFPSSVANIGMGLVSLCIADAMGWVADAEEQALTTLKSITGRNLPFNPDRNATGYFRHWIDMETGEQAWNSEYSTIDSGILTCGALFCKKYFCESDSIKKYADLLWESIDWSKSIQNPETGGIYLEMLADGEGKPGSVTLPFNEYIIVAWLAMNQEKDNPGQATELWINHYADPSNLLTKAYNGIDILTDNTSHFLSSFVVQFPFYLCNYFTITDGYIDFFDKARQADSLWWATEQVGAEHQWGLGAGSANISGGYHPDAIDNNPTHIYSPHIISGFLPVYQNGTFDLLKLYQNGEGIYTLPTANSDTILWRKSLEDLSWTSNELQGVDYSTMLFGLASLPEFLGVDFFIDNNNFFEEPCGTPTGLDVQNFADEFEFEVFPNPISAYFFVKMENQYKGDVRLRILSASGQLFSNNFFTKIENKFEEKILTEMLPKGVYVLELAGETFYTNKRIVKVF